MLNFVTSTNKIVMDRPDKINDIRSRYKDFLSLYDKSDDLIVEHIDKCMVDSRCIALYKSKFNDRSIGLEDLSSGARIALVINFILKSNKHTDYAIDISLCGANAIAEIADISNGVRDVDVLINHSAFGIGKTANIKCKYNGKASTLGRVREMLNCEEDLL